MKQLLRRLSRVADSSNYTPLRSETRIPRRSGSSLKVRRAAEAKPVPEGHVPVYVGEEMERFVISAELLNHPAFIGLLDKSAQEYGYEQKGVLRIPCHVFVFERVMEGVRLGVEPRHSEDFVGCGVVEEFYF